MSEIIKTSESGLSTADRDMITNLVTSIVMEAMQPIIQGMGTMVKNNTEAMDRLAAAQTIQNDRIEAMERQIRLNTPIDTRQEKYLNAAMKERARQLLDKRGLADDKKAVKKVVNAIKKAVLSRYGIGTMREIPKHEYSVAMSQIHMWLDTMVIRDTVKEARERMEVNEHGIENAQERQEPGIVHP